MKSRTAFLLILSILITAALTACAGSEETTVTETEIITETATEQITQTETEAETEPETETETETETEAETEPAAEEDNVYLTLPENSGELSHIFATELISLCAGYNEKSTVTLVRNAGFEIVFTKNYDKPVSDTSHTCAYTVGKGRYNGKNIYLVLIRGTSGGEWYSNFDFAPSHDNNTQYAESFYMAANDIYLSVKEIFDNDPDSYKVICGHSRGAAASNLLGTMLDSVYNEAYTYVYTFATPNTVRGEAAEKEYKNIFNFINPNDVVVHVPLEEHGFSRAGTDVMLPTDGKQSSLITNLKALSKIAPDIRSYYEDKHSLTQKGLSDDGLSVFDLMNYLAALFSANLQQADTSKLMTMSPESDLFSALGIMSEFNDTKSALIIANEHSVARYSQLIYEIYPK